MKTEGNRQSEDEGVENGERERWSKRLVETERELRQGQTEISR